MKTYKLILSALALVAVLSVNAFAQVSTDVTVTATAVSAISLAKTDVAFGNINTGTASVLKANINDNGTEANLGAGASAGSVTITGNSGSVAVVTFGGAILSDGTNSAAFTPSIWKGGTQVTSGGTLTLTGTDKLDIGGSLASISVAGAYSTATSGGSPLKVTVQYQ